MNEQPMTNHNVYRNGSWWCCRFCPECWPFPSPLPDDSGQCRPRSWDETGPAVLDGQEAFPMSDRKFIAAAVAVLAVPAVVAGVVLGVAVAVAYDRARSALSRPFWADPEA